MLRLAYNDVASDDGVASGDSLHIRKGRVSPAASLRVFFRNAARVMMVKKQRADAQRNRDHLLATARIAFVRGGAGATMDDIARQSGLGSGTLYRHFPTRDLLLEAVYRDEVEKLVEAAHAFVATASPVDALRSWMLLFVDHVASKRLILPALDAIPGGAMRLVEGSHATVQATFLSLVQCAKESGDLRADLDAHDVVRALLGVFSPRSCRVGRRARAGLSAS